MTVNLKKQVAKLQAQNAELIKERAEKEAAKINENRANLSNWVDNMIQEVYEELKAQIIHGVGLGDSTNLRTLQWSHILNATQPGSDAKTVLALIKERCGLSLVQTFPGSNDTEERDVLTVNLRDEVKVYDPGKAAKIQMLDFPALFAENRRRNQLWQESINGIAQAAIEICRKFLDAMDNKYYGIQDRIELTGDTGRSCFDACLQFDGGHMMYQELTDERLDELEAAINAMMSGGEIKFHRTAGCLRRVGATLVRNPEKVVKNPYFDYLEYWKPYDVVAEPLQKIFDEIIAGLKLTDPEEQIMALCPMRMLTFDFANYGWRQDFNFARVKRGLTNGKHMQSLFKAVNEAIPAIRVKQLTFVKSNKSSLVGKMQLEYEIVNNQDDFVCEQVKTERTIELIKSRKMTFIARAIAEVLLDEIEKPGLDCLFRSGYPRRSYYRMELARIELDGKMAGHKINMSKVTNGHDLKTAVTDEEFFKRVEREINRLTDGVLLVSLQERRFKLLFDKSIASAEHPMTLWEYDDWTVENG